MAEAVRCADPQAATAAALLRPQLKPTQNCMAGRVAGTGVPLAAHHTGGATAMVDVSSCVPVVDNTRQREADGGSCGQAICMETFQQQVFDSLIKGGTGTTTAPHHGSTPHETPS